MKIKFAAIGVMSLMVTGCVSPQDSEVFKANITINKIEQSSILDNAVEQANLNVKNLILRKNTQSVNKAINKLKKHIGKTWYVFSGATPAGWDCSGLVMWTYEQIGINLEHRASKQAKAGKTVKTPKLGDIVIFHYKGNKDAYHVGIYYDNGIMIHAPKKGHVTRFESISKFGGKYSEITYTRILNTL